MRNSLKDCVYLCSELARIVYVDKRGRRRSLCGNLEQIARTQLSLLLDSEISLGTSVVIKIRGHIMRGRPQTSRRHDLLGWFVDIQLEPRFRWSKQLFVPDHLFALPDGICASTAAA